MIEVAINGARRRSQNAHVPLSSAEIESCIGQCVSAGASVVHAHAGEAVVGSGGAHTAEPYLQPFAHARGQFPGLLLYPTLPGGGVGTTMQGRLQHVAELARLSLLGIVPVDPGTMNYGAVDAEGRPPASEAVYQTTFADVGWAFDWCRRAELPCTMSIFEPGFLRLVDAHDRAGSLPARSIVKLEFSAGPRLFGLPPTVEALDLYLTMFDSARIPWMVTLRDGDCGASLAGMAIERGGHVRVGIEDYGGPRQPTNDELVAHAAAVGRHSGRLPATTQNVQATLFDRH